jgi:NAD-dependent SIR2 family protein deacetylase
MFYKMMGRLSEQSQAASPTPFHHLLRTLDAAGSLRRVYTQNIDGLEKKAGLSYGMPSHDNQKNGGFLSAPRCIPLHGNLDSLRCSNGHFTPMVNHVEEMSSGIAPICHECALEQERRKHEGKRWRTPSRLRPDVLLYEEDHPDQDLLQKLVYSDVQAMSRKDTKGQPNILLVVGTSLQVPGAQVLVQEFQGVLARSPTAKGSTLLESNKMPIRTICVDLHLPKPHRKWAPIFDVWACGDVQTFARDISARFEAEVIRREDSMRQVRHWTMTHR